MVLTAHEHHVCADLSRRIQGYLLDWGQLDPAARSALRNGAFAHPGDLIVARRNDNQLQAGEHGHTLANTDMLKVEQISGDELVVRRRTGSDPATGQRTWSAPFRLEAAYAARHCDLGYALTRHAVEGETVTTGIALASDRESRNSLYVAMTRGRARNEVYAYPSAQEPKASGLGGPAPDAELAPAAPPGVRAPRPGRGGPG